ncbi:PAS domain-containing protein [Sphingomonas abaci]|uniref:histidine kinase n=1 Tax=Sphingomonas abaci TaxID=237611 RepID=A0A7W7AFB9_9SPHN|nr:PAS domain-containing protein [Sphingomonas abaci]MBB4615983.1 PAS domain S-box-containing protein [Sphingomonas abaci]
MHEYSLAAPARGDDPLYGAGETLARQVRFLEANLSAIPDYVYAFDRDRRFAYANPAMLGLFGLTSEEMLGKSFIDLDYPADLAALLNGHIDQIFADGATIQNEVFYRSPTGHAAYFSYAWGPVLGPDGSVELVVGVSHDTSERRAFEEALRTSEARLRAATELVGVGIYAWDPRTGALDWDDRLRAMWGLPSGTPIDEELFEQGIHPDDRGRVRAAIAACVDPAGDGSYALEYRVVGRDDGIVRHIATSGRATFENGCPIGFIGAAIDMTAQRHAEAAIRASEAQFSGFAEHSSNLLWIGDPATGTILYRSAAFERIWGIPREDGARFIKRWLEDVHPDDRAQVEHALATVGAGEVTQFEYRIIRPSDGAVRRLRDTGFPILDDHGAVSRIGGIVEDLTQDELGQVYIVSAKALEARRLAGLVRSMGYRARTFESPAAFLDIAAVLAPGCVLIDLRKAKVEGLSVSRELKARAIAMPSVVLDGTDADLASAVAAMKAGATDYIVVTDEAALCLGVSSAIAECLAAVRPVSRDETASARLARLTPRGREVLVGLVDGDTNKMLGRKLGISPRTVELHRAQVMNRLNAGSLAELIQLAMAAGLASPGEGHAARKPT